MQDNNEKFTDIDLSENCISEVGAMAIGEAISHSRQTDIMIFRMSWNRLKSKGVGAIAEAFVGFGAAASLETIDFSHNNIDDAHKYVIPLADLLLCKGVHSFDVSHNNLGPVFAKKLRENLSLGTCEARQVNVGFNPLGTFETAHIIEAMKLNKVRQSKTGKYVQRLFWR